MRKVLVIRHGHSEANSKGIDTPWDKMFAPLDERGKRESRQLGELLLREYGFDVSQSVAVSDLLRAQQTAEYAGFENTTPYDVLNEVRGEFASVDWREEMKHGIIPDSVREAGHRLLENPPAEEIWFSHGLTISALCSVLGKTLDFGNSGRPYPACGQIVEVELPDGKATQMESAATNPLPEIYGREYARKYIETLLHNPYTGYKNLLLGDALATYADENDLVLDVGCNINPAVNHENSLRYQVEQRGMSYLGVDLCGDYFDTDFLQQHGLPEENSYADVRGVTADARSLPFDDGSMRFIICADVIEHIEHPEQVFASIERVLTDDGKVLLVLPVMYKLDFNDLSHIAEIRHSTHVNKLCLDDWDELWEGSGLRVAEDGIKPLGIASGLSYWCWLDDSFISRQDMYVEECPDNSGLHARAKKVLSKYDAVIDQYIAGCKQIYDDILAKLGGGDILGAFDLLCEIANTVEMEDAERKCLDDFFTKVKETNFDPDRINEFIEAFSHINGIIGNSVIITLEKKQAGEIEQPSEESVSPATQ